MTQQGSQKKIDMNKNKTFKLIVLIGIIGNILVGVSYLFTTGSYWMAVTHIAAGIIFVPLFFDGDKDENDDNDDDKKEILLG